MLASGRAYRRWALANPTQYMVMFGRAVPDFTPTEAALQRAVQSFAALAETIERVAPGDDYAERAFHVFATLHGYVMLELSGMGAPTEEESSVLYERALHALGSAS